MTDNNTKNVSYGKFKQGGYFFVAPYGTGLPTDNTSELDPAFKNMGFLGDDGLVFSNDSSTNTGYDANGDSIATTTSEITKTMATTFREIKLDTMEVVYGAGNATDEGGMLTVHDKGPNNGLYSAVAEILLADGRKDRKLVPQCSPNQLGEETIASSELVGKPLTWTVLKDPVIGDYYTDFIDSTETSASEMSAMASAPTSGSTVAEIEAYAADRGIDLSGASTKTEKLAAVEAAV